MTTAKNLMSICEASQFKSYDIKDVIHETENHFVLRVKGGHEIYRNGITSATRCAVVGGGNDSEQKAIKECNRREKRWKPADIVGINTGAGRKWR